MKRNKMPLEDKILLIVTLTGISFIWVGLMLIWSESQWWWIW